MRVGGDAQRGVVTYIRHYGFYEGGGKYPRVFSTTMNDCNVLGIKTQGVKNDYRLDPAVLVALITGTCTLECIDVVRKKVVVPYCFRQGVRINERLATHTQEKETIKKLTEELVFERNVEADCRKRLQETTVGEGGAKRQQEEELAWIQRRRLQLEKAIAEEKQVSAEVIARLRPSQ